MKTVSAAKLVRISALPSALADVFGGMALAYALAGRGGYSSLDLGKLPWLLLATTGIYLGGMALNDVLHTRKDALLRKQRPIVTGEISYQAAWTIMASLFVLGTAGALMAGVVEWAALLIGLIFLYNWMAAGRIVGVEVRNPLWRAAGGVVVIALCRALHVSLPLLAHGDLQLLTRQPLWPVFVGGVFAYIGLVTVISLFEDTGGGRVALRTVSLLLYPVVLVLPVYVFARPGAPNVVFGVMLPLAVLAWLLITMHRMIDKARAEPTPPNLGRAVGAGIRGECLLMCGFALMVAPAQWWWGVAALACFPAGKVLSKWISPT